QLRKKFAIKEIQKVAEEIGSQGYKTRQKYGITLNRQSGYNKRSAYKKFAEKIVKSLPNKLTPNIIEKREVKRKVWQQKYALRREHEAFDVAKVKEDKKL